MAKGCMHGKVGAYVVKGACVAKGGVHGEGGHTWQRGACMAGGCTWWGSAWQERRPLQRTVRILLECILVFFYD